MQQWTPILNFHEILQLFNYSILMQNYNTLKYFVFSLVV